MRRAWTLLPAAVLTWIVAGLVTTRPESAPAVVAASAVAVAVVAVAYPALRRRADARRFGAVAVIAALAALVAASGVWAASESRERFLDLREGRGGGELTAIVAGKIERWGSDRVAFDAVTVSVAGAAEPLAVPVQIIVAPADVASFVDLDAGATVRAVGMPEPTAPGERAVARLHASGGVDVLAPPEGILRVSSDLRRGLLETVAGLPADGASLVPGLAVGDTLLVPEPLDEAMKQASLSHLTAVSGANCALVVGIAFGLVAAAGAGRGVRIAVAMVSLAGFVLLVTPEPSVVRAAGMAAVAMFALLLGRTAQGIAVLSAAVAGALALDPWLAGSLGFALSAAATASLLLFARPLAAGLARIVPAPLALVVAVPLAAQLACGPLLILITPVVPIYGVAANVLAAPAAPAVTVLGLAACLAGPLPVLASGLAALAWLPAAWIAATAATVGALPGDQLPWIGGPGGAVLLAAASIAVGLSIGLRGDAPLPRRVRGVSRALVAVLLGVVTGTAALGGVLGPMTIPAGWQILACDVGQGDAVLVRAGDQVALIDTGPDSVALGRCLERTGVDRVDLLVLTHFDHDHAGAADAVAGRTATVIHGPVGSAEDAAILAALEHGGAEVHEVAAGAAGVLGPAAWEVLWPPADRTVAPGNDASVVTAFSGGAIPSVLLLGDLSEAPQRQLLPRVTGRFEVVKVAHHGSADQSAVLYERIAARVGLVTVGADNGYGHPRAETLALVGGNGGVVARTDRHGLVAVWREGDDLSVWREHAAAVAPAG